MEDKGSETGAEQSYRNRKSLRNTLTRSFLKISSHQYRNKYCCSEHRKHMLQTQDQKPSLSKGFGISDRLHCSLFHK